MDIFRNGIPISWRNDRLATLEVHEDQGLMWVRWGGVKYTFPPFDPHTAPAFLVWISLRSWFNVWDEYRRKVLPFLSLYSPPHLRFIEVRGLMWVKWKGVNSFQFHPLPLQPSSFEVYRGQGVNVGGVKRCKFLSLPSSPSPALLLWSSSKSEVNVMGEARRRKVFFLPSSTSDTSAALFYFAGVAHPFYLSLYLRSLQLKGLGERCELFQWGRSQSHSRRQFCCIACVKMWLTISSKLDGYNGSTIRNVRKSRWDAGRRSGLLRP